jgi:hypothetical protein
MPRPEVWGPGLLDPSFEYRDEAFRFVERFAVLEADVRASGSAAGLERFRYWLSIFRFMESMGRVADGWRRINGAAAQGARAALSGDGAALRKTWTETMLPLRRGLFDATRAMLTSLSESVHDVGGMGVAANLQQASLPMMMRAVDAAFSALQRGAT